MNTKVCQCCAMPMETEELYGTHADGSRNGEYCKYCYVGGEMQFKGTMDEMIELCVPHMVAADPAMTAETAHRMMAEILPTLSFWKRETA